MKFDFSKSNDSDFRNKLQSQLEILIKNVLYLTYEIDQVKKIVRQFENNTKLQKQVDDYFEDDAEDTAEHIPDKIQEE